MALFGKNKSNPQKHHLIEVIKYEGPNNVFIWKYPEEDFNTRTQLIVAPSQEAIFIKGGQVYGHLPSGTHTLDTSNIPFLRALVGLVTGGVSPFSCSVYYVNKTVSMGIKWGTDAPIRMIDPHYSVPVELTANGDFSLRVENGHMLLEKLVGTTVGYTQDEITKYFAGLMAATVRSVISGLILEQNMSLYGIDSRLTELSAAAQERVTAVFEPYGLAVIHFVIANISYFGLEEIEAQIAAEAKTNIAFSNETYRHRVSTDVAAEDTVKGGHATAEANRALGFSAKEQAVTQIGVELARNQGPVGGAAGIGIGIPGIMGGVAVRPSSTGAFDLGNALLNHVEPPVSTVYTAAAAPAPAETDAPDATAQQPDTASAPPETPSAQSAETESPQDDFEKRALKVKFLLDKGMITQEQYDQKISQLMDEI